MVLDGLTGRSWQIGGMARIAAALGLGIAAEGLLYAAPVGWLYAVFVAALCIAALMFGAPHSGINVPSLALAGMGVIALAVDPHWASMLLAFLGATGLALSTQTNLVRDAWQWIRAVVLFAAQLPVALVLSVAGGSRSTKKPSLPGAALRTAKRWSIPVLLASIFLMLFIIGNPVVAEGAGRVMRFFISGEQLNLLDVIESGLRIGVAALLCWPFLRPPEVQVAESGPIQMQESFPVGMVIRTLILCNILFGMQNALDLLYLWAEGTLPATMTYAEYAHGGVYPLATAAVLVGALVIRAMPAGGAAERDRAARWLVFLWLAQTGLLTVSCLKRLDLYVAAYSLTYMRVFAVLATAAIGVGLLWIFLRLYWQRTNGWLINAGALTAIAMLFAGSVTDIGGRIAWYNVTHSKEMGGEGVHLDIAYLRYAVGPAALPALMHFRESVRAPEPLLRRRDDDSPVARIPEMIAEFEAEATDWRAWSVRRYWIGRDIRQRQK